MSALHNARIRCATAPTRQTAALSPLSFPFLFFLLSSLFILRDADACSTTRKLILTWSHELWRAQPITFIYLYNCGLSRTSPYLLVFAVVVAFISHELTGTSPIPESLLMHTSTTSIYTLRRALILAIHKSSKRGACVNVREGNNLLEKRKMFAARKL